MLYKQVFIYFFLINYLSIDLLFLFSPLSQRLSRANETRFDDRAKQLPVYKHVSSWRLSSQLERQQSKRAHVRNACAARVLRKRSRRKSRQFAAK